MLTNSLITQRLWHSHHQTHPQDSKCLEELKKLRQTLGLQQLIMLMNLLGMAVSIFLIANGLEPNPDGNNAEKMQQLWELSKGKIEARNCDFNDINLLEDYEGEIPTGSTGKPAARFNMIGLMTGGKKGESGAYRKEFVDYLQQSRIPKGTVLLCFPARRGEKDGKFNLVLTHEK